MAEPAKVFNEKDSLYVRLPLTAISGKARLKRRSCFCHYGEPYAPTEIPMSLETYMEWQIGYDALDKEVEKGKKETSLMEKTFSNYKGETKYGFELSEIIYYCRKKNIISDQDILNVYMQIKAVDEDSTFEQMPDMVPARTNPIEKVYNGMPFYKMLVSYPLLVHRFGKYDIFAEVTIREKQKAIGTQAMLYVCLPITSLKFTEQPIGRTVKSKECAKWVIGKEEGSLALELFRIFGMLSPKHRYDVLALFKMLFPDIIGW